MLLSSLPVHLLLPEPLLFDYFTEKRSQILYKVEEVLDVVRIIPHAETGNIISENGLLLRSDLHRLFDADLMRIDPYSGKIVMDRKRRNSYFGIYHDLSLPSDLSEMVLANLQKRCGLKNR